MSLDNNNNNSIFQKLFIDNEIEQIDEISKMNQLSLQTKIQLNLDTSNYKYLNLEDGRFIIYTKKEILLFKKNKNFKKLFPSNNDDRDRDVDTDIKFVKYINKRYIIFHDNEDLYISTIKSNTILPSKIEKVQNVLDVIELKNGMILAITGEDILTIKKNDNNFEVNRLSQNPFKNHKLLERDSSHFIYIFKLSIYELPKNNILISLILINSRLCGTFAYYCINKYRTEEAIYNLDDCKIIKNMTNYISAYDFEDSFKPYLIKIYDKYICISKKNNIYIYDITNYDLIKELNFSFNINTFNFDENIILVSKENEFSFVLYDLSDIYDIKYQKLYFVNDKKVMKIEGNNLYEINKTSEGKMVVNLPENVFIFDFTKNLQPLILTKIIN